MHHLPRAGNWLAYDAMEDRLYALDKEDGKTNTYRIELASYQSIFIVDVQNSMNAEHRSIPRTACGKETILDNDWKICIGQKDNSQVIEELTTLKNIASHHLYPEYSGVISYNREFTLESQDVGKTVYLYLGEVYEICNVFINGKAVGCKIAPPYDYDITQYVEKDNLLEIEVVNTFAKAKGDNYFDRSMLQEPSGLLGPVKLMIC